MILCRTNGTAILELNSPSWRHIVDMAVARGYSLASANLRGLNLQNATLARANLSSADMRGSNLAGAYLVGANLHTANLAEANLTQAKLFGANCIHMNLLNATVTGTDFRGANLVGTYFRNCNIGQAVVDPPITPEEGSFIGWKRCRASIIVKVRIPAKAERSSGSERKCRASEVKVLAIFDRDGKPATLGISLYDGTTAYTIGKTVKANKFEKDRWQVCAHGIHFYLSRIEAERHPVV